MVGGGGEKEKKEKKKNSLSQLQMYPDKLQYFL